MLRLHRMRRAAQPAEAANGHTLPRPDFATALASFVNGGVTTPVDISRGADAATTLLSPASLLSPAAHEGGHDGGAAASEAPASAACSNPCSSDAGA